MAVAFAECGSEILSPVSLISADEDIPVRWRAKNEDTAGKTGRLGAGLGLAPMRHVGDLPIVAMKNVTST